MHQEDWPRQGFQGRDAIDLRKRPVENRAGRASLVWQASPQGRSAAERTPLAQLARMTLSHPRFGYTGGFGFQEWPYRVMNATPSSPYSGNLWKGSFFRAYSGYRAGAGGKS